MRMEYEQLLVTTNHEIAYHSQSIAGFRTAFSIYQTRGKISLRCLPSYFDPLPKYLNKNKTFRYNDNFSVLQ